MLKKIFAPLALGTAACAFAQVTPKQDLSGLSIEDLMKIEVITANRSGQSVMLAPAAVFVLTGEDIRRSGARTIPDMLIGIPGVTVARISGNKWMVSMRGFNGRFANKLQVLIDGHSIYNPLFSGVFWDDYRLSPDDIERIEVVRGPFGSTWGANAVNGVINIVTKHASASPGWQMEVLAGDSMESGQRLRFSREIGKNSYLRVSGQASRFDDLETANGASAGDAWRADDLSFRFDSNHANEKWRVSGYLSNTRIRESSLVPTLEEPFAATMSSTSRNRQGYVNVNWTRAHGPDRDTTIQASYNDSDREDFELPNNRKTIDLEWREDRRQSNGRSMNWGVSYRSTADRVKNTEYVSLNPSTRQDELFGAFFHYENPLSPGVLLHSDAMLEHNDYTGWEFQPSLALTYAKSEKETFWSTLSRSVRSPSRSESDSSIWLRSFMTESTLPAKLRLVGDPDFKAEEQVSFEIGWRFQPTDRASYDVSAFASVYNNLRSFEMQAPGVGSEPMPHVDQVALFGNKLNAFTSGIEGVARFNPAADWRLILGYAFFHDNFSFDSGSSDAFGEISTEREGSSPRHTASVRSSHDLRGGFTVDLMASYTDRIRTSNIDSGTRLDLRLGWSPSRDFELSLVGQNLLDRRRREGETSLFETVSYVPRGIFGTATWRF